MPSSSKPPYLTLLQRQEMKPGWPDYLLHLEVAEDQFNQGGENHRHMISLILASPHRFMGQPYAQLYAIKDIAIVAFNRQRIDIELLMLEEAEFYDTPYGPLPQEVQSLLSQWAQQPNLLVDHVQQLANQLPGNK